MNENRNFLQIWIPAAILALLLVTAITAVVKVVTASSVSSPPLPSEGAGQITEEKSESILGVLKDRSEENGTVTICNVENGSDLFLYYNGGADIQDKYGQIVSMPLVEIGEMVEITYLPDSNKLTHMNVSKQAFAYYDVKQFILDRPSNRIIFGEEKFNYDENLVIIQDNKSIGLLDLNEKDIITIKGKDKKICSIIVTKGHGDIRLKNYNDFIGGTAEIGNNMILPITEKMVITATEGEYKITFENQNLKASKYVQVTANEDVIIDLSNYKKEPEKIGSVDFLITPFNALLYVDGKETDFEKPVKLVYGKHDIKVMLEGYSTYSGYLDVKEAGMVISVDLVEADAKKEQDTNDDKDTEDNVSALPEDTSDDIKAETAEENKIYVNSPAGAVVYFDGQPKGTIPCSFPKSTGVHTISVYIAGKDTQSYPITIPDDGKDFIWELPYTANSTAGVSGDTADSIWNTP